MRQTHLELLGVVDNFYDHMRVIGVQAPQAANLLTLRCNSCGGWNSDCPVCFGTNVMKPSTERCWLVMVEMLENDCFVKAKSFGQFVKDFVL